MTLNCARGGLDRILWKILCEKGCQALEEASQRAAESVSKRCVDMELRDMA